VLLAIKFDNQFRSRAAEICDIWSDRLLTAKAQTEELFPAQF
jgi:hypothetical protein